MALALPAGTLLAVEPPPPPMSIRAPLMQTLPEIDGSIGEDEWRDAFRGVGMIVYQEELCAARKAVWWIGTDGRRVFAAVRSELPSQGELLARTGPVKRDPFGINMDDGVELWLAPNYPSGTGVRYCQFVGNPAGAIADTVFDLRGAARPWDGDWAFANGSRDGWWETELAIAVDELLPEGELRSFAFRLTRNWKQPWQYSSTESAPGGFKQVKTMSRFYVDPAAPRVRMIDLDGWLDGKWDVRLGVGNPGERPEKVWVKMRAEAPATGMATQVGQELVDLAAHGRQEVHFERSLTKRDVWTGRLLVGSEDGRQVWFSREWRFRTERPEELWTTAAREKKSVALHFGYSPYRNRIRAKVDYSGVSDPSKVRRVTLEVWAQAGARPVTTARSGELSGSVCELAFDVPALSDGTYEIRCTLEADTLLKDAAVGQFVRERYEWERNTLGISDEVVPPFTPLEVAGDTVKAVFRQHKLNASGLWDQVWSEGVPLLARPMEIRAVVDGEPVEWRTDGLHFTETKSARVQAQAAFGSAGVEAQTHIRFDYDGLMAVDLELAAKPEVTVDRLDLMVPVRDDEAPLMHAAGAGFSANYAGKIPAGMGEVWSNTEAVTYGVPNQFIPYLWVGGTRRGVCWTADSDRDWVAGPERRGISLVRDRGAVSIVLHLVATPTRLDRARRFSFGFQATPVKPRPKDWRSWVFYGGFERPPGIRMVRIFGCCPYWGAVTESGDLYPRGRDFGFIERLVAINRRGAITDEDRRYLDEWNSGYRQEKHLEFYTRCTKYGFHIAQDADVMVPYTNIRAVRETMPEFLQFQDEWVMQTYTSRHWSEDDRSYERIEPVRSHQDFALWYYKRMMDMGFAGGIYWDLSFAQANHNPMSSSACYRAEDGTIHPGMGISSVRELMKRAYVMYSLAGRLPYHVDHMSNNAIIPKQAFSTIQLDWELKYGTEDFQDRFPEDYILATSTGEQAGTVPTVLTGIKGTQSPEERTWLTRTLLGTTLVYELKGFYSFEIDRRLIGKAHDIVYGFGYGQTDCLVYRYWEDPPFEANRADLRCILYSRGDKLMLVATDFGDGGPCRVRLDLAKLGLTGRALTAANAETEAELAVDGSAVGFGLRKHDFLIVQIGAGD